MPSGKEMYGDTFPPIRAQVIWEIEQERARQDGEWGGAEHDDEHDRGDWPHFIFRHNDRALEAARDGDVISYRYQLVRVAALAIAALESERRKDGE